MAHRPDTTDRRADDPRDERPAPSYPQSPRKAAVARRRRVTEAILRARQAA